MSAMNNVIRMPGVHEIPRNTPRTERSIMETMELTLEGVAKWKKPPFQRDVRNTARLAEVVEQVKRDGVIEGVVTLGRLVSDLDTYLLDGQHRREAFVQSGLQSVYADIRITTFETMSEMADEFIRLNTAIARMKTDDIVRAMEGSHAQLYNLRHRCPCVGYSLARGASPRDPTKARGKVMMTMSLALRSWFGSATDTPTEGPQTTKAVDMLDAANAKWLGDFLTLCSEAWGTDIQNFRLWGGLTMGILMWMYRRSVLGEGHKGLLARATPLTPNEFKLCLMSLSADATYADWLVGRGAAHRHRAPAYQRIKGAFSRRLAELGKPRAKFPQAEW